MDHRNESSCRCFPARPLLDGRYTQLFRNGHEKYPVKYSCCNYALFSGERESPNPLMIEGAGGVDAPKALFYGFPVSFCVPDVKDPRRALSVSASPSQRPYPLKSLRDIIPTPFGLRPFPPDRGNRPPQGGSQVSSYRKLVPL